MTSQYVRVSDVVFSVGLHTVNYGLLVLYCDSVTSLCTVLVLFNYVLDYVYYCECCAMLVSTVPSWVWTGHWTVLCLHCVDFMPC